MAVNWTESKRMALIVGAVVLLITAISIALYIGPLYLRLGLLAVLVLLALVVYRHARRTEYECPRCHAVFHITFLNDLLSPHFPDRKLLVCKSCRHTGFIPVKR